MLNPISQLDGSFRDTLVHRAEGESLSKTSAVYGFIQPQLASVSEAHWRRALTSVALRRRGVPGTTFEFLYHGLGATHVARTAARDPAQPHRLGSNGTAWTQSAIGRWVRNVADGTVYRIVGPSDVSAVAGAYVEVAPIATSYWAAGDWSTLAAADVIDIEVLGFTFTEPTPGLERPADEDDAGVVFLWLDAALYDVPPNYLQSGGGARPVGQPYGGHFPESVFQDGSQVIGPFPFYLSGKDIASDLGEQLRICLPSGQRLKTRLLTEGL